MGDFRKLIVWQAAQVLVVDAHRIASGMRGVGSVALRDQLTRAAISVPTNIVEGSAHESPREFARFLRYSLASVSELEGHAQIASDLGMIAQSDFSVLLARIVHVRKMLHGLLKTLASAGSRQPTAGNRQPVTGDWQLFSSPLRLRRRTL